jgi:hypothetical protein
MANEDLAAKEAGFLFIRTVYSAAPDFTQLSKGAPNCGSVTIFRVKVGEADFEINVNGGNGPDAYESARQRLYAMFARLAEITEAHRK